ncbi:MAG: MazG nucleotide pyrophosphohydrolase domain-containing protein [Candidatus Heimdallarchaeota archaeon]
MEKLFIEKDRKRGKTKTMLKLVEEIGELAESILLKKKEKIEEELADIFAWTLSIANLYKINLNNAFKNKYQDFCPECRNCPCSCDSV